MSSWILELAQEFQELLEQLQQQVLQQTFQGMQQSLQSMTPEDMADMRNMLSELNQMLEDKQNGGEPDFERFMHKYGHYFGPGINSLEDLMDRMAQQMAAMQSLMDSMSQEQRKELWEAMQSVMNDPGIQEQMDRLGENLGQMMPDNPYAQAFQFGGGEELSLNEALRLMDRLHEMDEVEDQLRGVRDWRDLENVDDQKMRDLLGDDFQQDLDQLRQLTKLLEDAGYIQQGKRGFEMTPRGVRKIGQKALTDIFQHLKKDRFGQHKMDDARRRRRAHRRHQSLRVRRSVPARPAQDTDELGPARGGRLAAQARCDGLRGLPYRADDADIDGTDGRHEPLDALQRLLRRRQEGRAGAGQPDPHPVPAGQPLHPRLLLRRHRAQASRNCRRSPGTSTTTAPTCSTASCWPASCSAGTRAATSRSSSSPTASRPPTSRDGRCASPTRRPTRPSRRR